MGEIKQIFSEIYNLYLFKVITFDRNTNRFSVLKKRVMVLSTQRNNLTITKKHLNAFGTTKTHS
jgi:hypothetical protein